MNNSIDAKFNECIQHYYKASKDKSTSLSQKKKAINTALQCTQKRNKDTFFSKILYQKNVIHLQNQEYDSLLVYQKLLLNHAATINDKLYLAKQYLIKAFYFDEVLQLPDSAFHYYNISKDHFITIKDSSGVGKNLLYMGLIQQNQNDYFGSKETLTEALQYLNPTKNIRYISSAYNALATNHRKLLNYEDAINYYSKAIKVANSEKDKLICKNNIAVTHVDHKQYEKAIALLSGIIKDSLFQNIPKEYNRAIDNLAYAKWLSGQNKTEKPLLEVLNIRIKNNDKRGQIASYTHLGEFYSKDNSMKASAYFDSVIRLSKDLKMPRAEKDAVKFLMKVYPKNVELRNRYVFLQDSLYAQELKVKTQFAKYKYDDKQKQESILRLQKEKAEKDLAYTKERHSKIIYLSAFILACLIIAFAIYFFKRRAEVLKQQNELEKLEAVYNTEAELSRKLHDDFGAKINHSMLLVQNDSDKYKLLDALDELYNQSRDFSREINEVETGANYKNELFDMFSIYTSTQVKLYTTGSKSIDWSTINDLSKIVLYKVLRELMINMLKHSNATAVKIAFKTLSDGLQINYSDNGVGASKMAMQTKNGLRNTEKRIQAIGGTIIFETDKGKGFKAEIKTPN
ncbi:hypothetical protein GCM10022396_09470 [Flavivirga amylovorans]